MKLAMLGGNSYYQYGYAPLNGSYRRSTGNYLGQDSMSDTIASINAAGETVKSEKASSWARIIDGINSAIDTGANLIDAINLYKSGATQAEIDALNKMSEKGINMTPEQFQMWLESQKGKTPEETAGTLTWDTAMPWVIGGGALLLGIALLSGTRRRRR